MDSNYVVGDAHPRRTDYARFETKQGEGSGAGYERWRSYEWRPETARREKEDVYVAHHRLLAVVACYPDDMPVSEILDHMEGKDVHHSAPEVDGDRGVEWDNRPDCLQVVEHGRHAEITQAQMRAWGEDARREATATSAEPDGCARCEADEAPARVDGVDGELCLDCAMDASDGGAIEVV